MSSNATFGDVTNVNPSNDLDSHSSKIEKRDKLADYLAWMANHPEYGVQWNGVGIRRWARSDGTYMAFGGLATPDLCG